MTNLIILAVAVAVIGLFLKILRNKGKKIAKSKNEYKYQKKKFFMSRAEHECYDALVVAVEDKYYVFPQVHLDSIIDNKVVGQDWKGAFKHINQKSVDFVLCDKGCLSPKLAIELDDKTHERQDRKKRDVEVERILEDAELPLLRLENHGHFNSIELNKKISFILNN